MSLRKHDKAVRKGFDIDPEQLMHDLTILKLSKSSKLTADSNEWEYYDAYIETLHKFIPVIEDKTRYDSSFNK